MVSNQKMLRSLLAVILEAAAPLLGPVIRKIAEEGGSLLLDASVEKRARDLHERLFGQIMKHARILTRTEGLPQEHLAYLLPAIERTIERHGMRLGEWSGVHFSVERATTAVIKRAGSDLSGLSIDDVEVVRGLVDAFHSTLLAESETLRITEAEFRSKILDDIKRLSDVINDQSEGQAKFIAEMTARAAIGLPKRPWLPGISPPGALLRADIEDAVPFHGRGDETANIEKWCYAENWVAVRLYTGQGGMGKTRLFIEMCERLQARRWRAGFLDRRADSAPAMMWTKLVSGHDPLFLVVDYAETRRTALGALLREAFRVGRNRRIRIVLLARAADDWWRELKSVGGGVEDLLTGAATQWLSLGPLALSADDRGQSYRMAIATFAKRLKPEHTPSDDAPEDINSRLFERILLLHMNALATIDGVSVKGDQGILDYVLLRERRFWAEKAEAMGLPPFVIPGIAQAMACLTLRGGAKNIDEALAVLRQIPRLRDANATMLHAVSTLLHDTYPGTKWIEPILPDLLGEHLAQVELNELGSGALLDLVFGAREVDAGVTR